MRLAPWVLLLLAILLLLAGCNYQLPGEIGPLFEPPKEPVSDPQADLKAYLLLLGCPDTNSLDECHFRLAQSQNQPNQCKDIADSPLRQDCYFKLASTNQDESLCQKIIDTNRFDGCLLFLLKNKPDYIIQCSKLRVPANEKWCMETIGDVQAEQEARQRPYLEFCNRLAAEPRIACMAVVKSDQLDDTFCARFETLPVKEPCLLELAQRLSKYSLCAQITAQPLFNSCILHKAIYLAKPEVCKEARSEEDKISCIKDVGIALAAPAVCRSISASLFQVPRFECFDGVAVALANPELCGEIKHKDKQGFCVGKIAVANQDPGLCADLRNEPLGTLDPFLARDSCYVYAAERLGLAEPCEKVVYAPRKAACQANVALGVKSDSVDKPSVSAADGGPKTCEGYGGEICAGDGNCMGNSISTVDTYSCCLGNCSEAGECRTSADCDDRNPATLDKCKGSPTVCKHYQTSACSSGDGFCPSGCSHAQDSDCNEDECQQESDCDTAVTRANCQKGTCLRSSHPYKCTYSASSGSVCN